jgi:uncharacterized membrane protein YfcA
MDTHLLEVILGVALAVIGAYFAFSERHYANHFWRSKAKLSSLGPERTTRLAKFQGTVIFIIGADLVISGATGYDPLAEMLTALHL